MVYKFLAPGRLNFIRWRIIFVKSRYRTCFILAPRILGWILGFWKSFTSLSYCYLHSELWPKFVKKEIYAACSWKETTVFCPKSMSYTVTCGFFQRQDHFQLSTEFSITLYVVRNVSMGPFHLFIVFVAVTFVNKHRIRMVSTIQHLMGKSWFRISALTSHLLIRSRQMT
jgi:hypothetical protein